MFKELLEAIEWALGDGKGEFLGGFTFLVLFFCLTILIMTIIGLTIVISPYLFLAYPPAFFFYLIREHRKFKNGNG